MTATPTAGSGTAPFTYTINATPVNTTGTISGTFTGLTPGSYTITFTDANGCSGTTTQTVAAGPALTATGTTTGTACPTVNNGTFTVTAPTGTAPFTYTINATPANTTGATSGVFTGLAAGPYTVTFTAANGCTGTVTQTVAQGAAITATSTVTATSCNNAVDGSITATPTAGSGTAPFTYTINATPANTTGATSGTFTGLAPGAYVITFTDANGCTGTTGQTVVAGPALTATASTTATSCPTVNNGTVTVTAPTGIAPFTYTIDAVPANTTGATSGVFTGLPARSYTVTFTAANGCTGTVAATVAQGAAITATSSKVNTSCNNATDGSMTANPSGGTGTAPFTYTIDAIPVNTTGAASGTFTGLAAGTYIITFTDANGCSGTVTQTVTAGAALAATPATTGTACPGIDNGTFTATAPTGVAPFTYTINATPAHPTGAATGTFTGLAAGTYIISFTSSNGCTGTVTGTVAQGAALTSTATSVNPNCAGINDGTFTVTPTNGTAPYSYTIDAVPANTTGASTGSFTGLAPGTYIITFTDANGCTGTQTKTLTTNAAITTPETHTDVKCFGGADGTITLTPAGGVAPFIYALLPSTTFQTSSTITGLSAGSHTIRVKDNVGCTKDTTIIIAEPVQLTASAVKDNNATCEGNDGGITVTAAGGTAPYQYSIDNGVTFQAAGVFTNAVNATYSGNIKVKDANGCTATANSVTVGQDNNLTLDILVNPDTTICQGSSVKFSPVLINAGAGATYSWTSLTPVVPNSTIDTLTILNATVSPVDTAIYKLTVTYKACTISDNVPVNVIWKPIVNAGPSAVSICRGDSILLVGSVTHTSGPIDSLVWTPTDSLTTPSSVQTWAHPVSNTYYHLTAFTSVANYGCVFAPQAYDSIKVVIPAPVVAFAGNDTIAVKGQPHQLLGSGGVAYSWWSPTASVTFSNPLAQNPFVTLYNDANFFVEVKNATGCADTAHVFVKVLDGPTYYIPNAFSPNGDGLNDVFRAIPAGMANTQYFKVMNRYGETVFETNQYLKGWDGTYKGKKQPLGVYVWIVKGQDKDGKIVEMKGTVMLVQ
jgi:gliding motility-associated-like protein